MSGGDPKNVEVAVGTNTQSPKLKKGDLEPLQIASDQLTPEPR
jgi:hypothetical protein